MAQIIKLSAFFCFWLLIMNDNFVYTASVSIVTIISLIVYLVLSINVGRARAKYKVAPPATTGNPDFERYYRVQQNTVEQIILFLPSLWLFAMLVSPLWASIIGAFWPIGRIVYALGYYKKPELRFAGFGLTILPSVILLIGSLISVIIRLINN